MEISSESPRVNPGTRPVRGPHGGWQQEEIDALEKSVSEAERTGESLRSVFDRMAKLLGRKPNSIRNFYYAQLRAQEQDGEARPMPFETFSPEEVEQLLEHILTARARGMSVRACVRNLADGDRTLMLRYQNKYRSTIRNKPELVRRVMARLDAAGTPYVSPFDDGEPFEPPERSAKDASREDPRVARLYHAIDELVARAYPPPREETAFPLDSDALRRADRLAVQCDMLRIELDDEKTRGDALRAQAEDMATLLREYIALPESDRLSHCAVFCQEATKQLSAMEAAMMDEPGEPE